MDPQKRDPQRPIGRGIGRSSGRGILPTTAPSHQQVPEEAAQEIKPGLGRGRGRGMVASPSKVSEGSSASQPAAPSAVTSGSGRGISARGISAQPIGSMSSSLVSEKASREARASVSASAANIQQIQQGVARMAVAEPSKGEERGARGEPRGAPGEPRPEELGGQAAAVAERERRTAELKQIQKPIGTVGRRVELLTNAVEFSAAKDAMVYEYRVDFTPQTWSTRLRPRLIEKALESYDLTYLFDFDNLFLAQELPVRLEEVVVDSPFPASGDATQQYKLNIRRVMTNRANDSKELLNLIVKNMELGLKFVQIGKNRFDTVKRALIKGQGQNIPQMEILPGYSTAVNPFSAGILLTADASFRVIRVGSVKNLIDEWKQRAHGNQEYIERLVRDTLYGSSVLTPYNDKSYIVSEVRFDQNPMNSFKVRRGGQEVDVTFVQYYKQQYDIDIKDLTQPLMYSKPTPVGNKKRENRILILVPELCQLTGIQDDLRANFHAMKAITTATKLDPNERQRYISEYLRKLTASQEAQDLMKNWGITISQDLLKVTGRALPQETLIYGDQNRSVQVTDRGDWTREVSGAKLPSAISVKNWALIFLQRDIEAAKQFSNMFISIGRELGMNINGPNTVQLTDDKNIIYANTIGRLAQEPTQLIVLIFPTSRDDRYAAVKKACYIDNGVPSQVINARTLSKPDRLRAIVQKIALQINCKLGGFLWRMAQLKAKSSNSDRPLRMMVMGIDAYHDIRKQRDSVLACVASTDPEFTRWHSRCNPQQPRTELAAGLKVSFMSSLNAYVQVSTST